MELITKLSGIDKHSRIVVGLSNETQLYLKCELTFCVNSSPNITAELNKSGEIIGMEILEASSFIRDSIRKRHKLKC